MCNKYDTGHNPDRQQSIGKCGVHDTICHNIWSNLNN